MRGRAALLITTMAVALVVASGVALAADIKCPNRMGNECVGTNKSDTMTGTDQADDMDGRRGRDTMLARGGDDVVSAGQGNDKLDGGPNPSTGPPENLSGGYGDDTYLFSAGWGADRIPADGEGTGMGTDTLDFSSLLVEPLDVDLDSSRERNEVFSHFSDAGVLNFPATVEIEDVTGGEARDVIRGNELINRFVGNGGNDKLAGRGNNDVLSGGLGADALNGGTGNDELNGGDINSDVYLFEDGWGRDIITDAAGADRLSFSSEPTSSVTVALTVDLVSGRAYETASGSFELSPNRVSWTPGVIDSVTSGYGDDTIDVADGIAGETVDCGPGTDKVDVDAVQDPSTGTINPIDSATNCETVNKVLIN